MKGKKSGSKSKNKSKTKSNLICLGIESTAHTFGVGIVDENANVFANVINAFKTKKGGMIPGDVANHHVDVCDAVIKNALEKANLTINDIDLISFSQSPGIGHCLRIGAGAARSLASIHNKPLIGVNHCIAHLEIGNALTKSKDPVLLYASGANTQVIAYEGGKYRVFGETLDVGVGNFLDAFARHAGLGFPGGPQIEKYASQYKKKDLLKLPYSVKGMDLSFTGMLSNLKTKFDSGKYSMEELCYALQETAFAMLIEVSERAMAHTDKKELLLGGGVACNKRLQEMAKQMCKDRGAKCFVLENQFNVDNGAMIAWQGILQYNSGERMKIIEAVIKPYLRTDDIRVNWR